MGPADFAETERQAEIYTASIEHGVNGAARQLGISHARVSIVKSSLEKKAARQGWSPEHDMTKTVPDGFKVKGVSTLYDKDGKVRNQWVKSMEDRERQAELMREACQALAETLPKVKAGKAPAHCNDDLMAVYPLGDPHIGVLSWGAETGQDWDLNIAEEKFCGVFDRLVRTAPKCKQAVIVNLGDYFHVDNMAGVTARSGHTLDLDGRYAKMVWVGVKIIRQMIASALAHHESVRVINAVGNHDDTGALFLSVALANMYEGESRVEIDTSPAPFHYFRHGKNLFGVHHGHSCKSDRLPGVMAADQAKLWGETEYRYWLTGHIHHDTKKEHAGCVVESFRTLAAKDAYATWGGYRALQDSKCLVIHKDFGEVERHTVNLAMVGE
ncbi:hypothetical protein [Microbulbifer sp. THAF38]|uniref:hypothetical protein n=1 Tax=Microbulbifer sp. THAF38 TaxID=2587856 RepID=UPI0012AA6FF6|nr:hypothetical protein [Microbulbifer sp. THAF38]QFT55593.1 hypothetical protein FIU95_13645 [Microbulbifer sp. THAF38]